MFPPSEALLTETLRQNGRLTAGEVVSVAVTPASQPATMSTLLNLEIGYSPDAEGDVPDRCLMKVVEPAQFPIGRSEVEFYRFAAASPGDGLVDCYGTRIDEEGQTAFILLEERRGPFVQTEWPIPSGFEACRRAVEAIGRFHAAWWESDEARRIGQYRQLPQADPERLNPRMAKLFDTLGDALSPTRRALIEHLVADYPTLHAERLNDAGRRTIVHGDAHLWNFLIPTDASRPPVLIDWQLWGVDYAAADLAYMMALHWFPERRARFERDLVRVWVDTMQANGVRYAFDDAWSDYRFLVAGLLLRVVVYSTVIPASIWWPHLERAFLAFEDLACAELIGHGSR
jgi:hypothetical protein